MCVTSSIRSVLVAACLVVAACAGAMSPTVAARQCIGARLNLEFAQVDLGTISDAAPVRVSIRFTNRGDGPLILHSVQFGRLTSRFQGPAVIAAASDVFVDARTGEGFVGPRLTVQPRVHEGYVNAEGTCTVSIPIVNSGDMPLEIVGVVGPEER
jgi:hypothetical protein